MNILIIDGHLGKDPELKQTQSGIAVCKITIANTTGFGDKEKTYWIDSVAFKKTAEYICNYAHKGDYISCSGILTQQSWDDKDTGKKRSKMEFAINKVEKIVNKTNHEMKKDQSDDSQIQFPDDDIPF